MIPRLLPIPALLLFSALAATAEARPVVLAAADLDQFSLEDLLKLEVVTASRHKQQEREAPSSVSVITAADIRKHGWRNLQDILNAMPGLFFASDRIYNFIGSRGFIRPGDYNARHLLLIDGYRVNDNIYQQAYLGNSFLLDVADIERVEFSPGAGSSLYGDNAFLGVIQVITRDGAELNGSRVRLRAGPDGTLGGALQHGVKLSGGGSLLLSASHLDDAGQDIRIQDQNIAGRDGDVVKRAFLKWRQNGWQVEAGGLDRRKQSAGLEFANDAAQLGQPAASTEQQGFLSLHHAHDLNDRWQGDAHLYLGDYKFIGDYSNGDHDLGRGRWTGGEYRLLGRLNGGHTLTTGVEYRREIEQQQTYNSSSDTRSSTQYGVYLQDEYRLNPRWILNAGLRYDHVGLVGRNATSPRVAIIHQWDDDTSVKALYSHSFRAPSAFERYYPYYSTGTLKPEGIDTTELAINRRLSAHMKGSLTLFDYRVSDIIELNNAGNAFVNSSAIKGRGIEAVLDYARDKTHSQWSYTYAAVHNTDGQITGSPRHVLKWHLQTRIPQSRFDAAFDLLAMSKRKNEDGSWVSGHSVAHLNLLARDIRPGLSLSLGVYNLFDARYQDPLASDNNTLTPQVYAIDQARRTWRAGLEYAF